MNGPLGCVRVFTLPKSLVAGRMQTDAYKKTRTRVLTETYTPPCLPSRRDTDDIIYSRDIHIWTDGSALDNGTDMCTAGSAWVSDLQISDKVMLTGAVLTNNVAEVAAIVLCLMAWRDTHMTIHTDSTFVLGLLEGGLLAMERDGWGNAPRHMRRGSPTPLLQYLLYLLRDRTGRLRFIKAKAHGDDLYNNLADALANEGQKTGRIFDISEIKVPQGWVDIAPVLCHQPLDYLTRLVVRSRIPAPTSTNKFERFSDRWVVMIGTLFDRVLDPGNHIKKVWSINVPEGLKEVLWKEMNGALVLGHRYHGTKRTKSDMGCVCPCSKEMSLGHVLLGCATYDLQLLFAVLRDALAVISPRSSFRTLHPDEWGSSPWYPILALQALEEMALPIFKGQKKVLSTLKQSRPKREWLIGTYYWMIWKWRMKEIHEDDYKFMPTFCVTKLREALVLPCQGEGTAMGISNENRTLSNKTKLMDDAYR